MHVITKTRDEFIQECIGMRMECVWVAAEDRDGIVPSERFKQALDEYFALRHSYVAETGCPRTAPQDTNDTAREMFTKLMSALGVSDDVNVQFYKNAVNIFVGKED